MLKKFTRIIKPIIIIIIGITVSFLWLGIIFAPPLAQKTLYLFDNLAKADPEKALKEFDRISTVMLIFIQPLISVFTGGVVGFLSDKKAWLWGIIAIIPFCILFTPRYPLIKTILYPCVLIFLCSFASHGSYKLKTWCINKIKKK